ncbi:MULTISPECIES: metallophosphoesterase [unclassified Oceanispirochaeta]|uniref:metallophosphoesterase n=1 Tax=unclassified Oceanispirochaeta TaxID=2635722 RepID=UPI000E0964A1|nr:MULTISPECIES: metallophosphoesterase [unclassified Oceanispirochaeta]MBF9016896.1 metallophosphoesterase [Oceanispirochaeta sp. M2]NPD73259.1 hypothetical protein [Oceanispirochaeta sp. M1]RDG31125.1 hypothetical protein DV872_14250 [Oceanispirochaeta sp. M1]
MTKKKLILIIAVTVLTLVGLLFALMQWATINNLNVIQGIQSSEIWFEGDSYDRESISSLVKADDEDFTILLLSDIQLESHPIKDKKSLKLIDELVGEIKPDFIMTAGDNTSWIFSVGMTKKLIKQLESYDIPWGVTLGNHDSEGLADRSWHGNQYENGENSFFKSGPSNIHGIGNYSVNIENEKGEIIYTLVMMDSNIRRNYEKSEDYDFIYYDQIKWYEWLIEGVQSEIGSTVPSLLFFHIPLPEFENVFNAVKDDTIDTGTIFGENRERIFSPPVNTGLFERALALKSTTHIFCGHDHVNSLSAVWRGIRLTYGLKSGPNSYSDDDMRGATLITIEDDTNKVVVQHIYK